MLMIIQYISSANQLLYRHANKTTCINYL